MILLFCILFILFEAITEGLLKRFNKAQWLFNNYVQAVIATGLFIVWLFVFALPFDSYYVPTWKLITGFIFVRFLIFDPSFNLSAGLNINHIGTKKWYDKFLGLIRDMWGISTIWFARIILGIIGVCFLLGIS